MQVLYGTEDLNQARKKFLKKRSLSAPAKCRKEMAKPILRQRSLLNPSIHGNEIVHKEVILPLKILLYLLYKLLLMSMLIINCYKQKFSIHKFLKSELN